MPGVCEVCSSEQSKYRCPTCALMSCSLACTQSHKIYCAPKPESPKPSEPAADTSNEPESDANGAPVKERPNKKHNGFDLKSLGSSAELKDLFTRYPQLRAQLRDMFKTTLEEEWVETSHNHGGRGRPYGRGRGGARNRGPWTREKGFNRGLGKVRKLRERCEDGSETGKDAEGFMRFVAMVVGEDNEGEPA